MPAKIRFPEGVHSPCQINFCKYIIMDIFIKIVKIIIETFRLFFNEVYIMVEVEKRSKELGG